MSLKILLATMTLLSTGALARADNIQTIGQDTSHSPTFTYPYTTVVGTFSIQPGDSAITISGTFGNSAAGSSAPANLYLGSFLVATCQAGGACNNAIVPFSDTLTASQIAALGVGPVNFTATQTGREVLELGTTTLDQVSGVAATPEPSSIALLGTGLLSLAGLVRRRLA